jgi:hypothetical protein
MVPNAFPIDIKKIDYHNSQLTRLFDSRLWDQGVGSKRQGATKLYNMDTCHKNDGLNLYILKLLYLIYLHKLCIIILCASSTKVNPMLT